MRWDRLFADLEAEAVEIEKAEHDALAEDLRDEMWGMTSWRELLGGWVVLEVRGAGQLAGEIASVNAHVIRMRSDLADHLVASRAVRSALRSERRADPPGRLDAAMGWSIALRRIRDTGDPVRVTLDDGSVVDGRIEVVGQDFVRLSAGASRSRLLVMDAVSVVTAAR